MSEFKGLCPICYLPVKADDDSRMLENGDRQEMYHANCLHEYVAENTPSNEFAPNAVLSILEQYKKVIIGADMEKRKQWALSQVGEWQMHGAYLRILRESLCLSLTETAKQLCISPARLKRLENGEPVQDARLLRRSYYILMNYIALGKQFMDYQSLTESVYEINEACMEQFAANWSDGE